MIRIFYKIFGVVLLCSVFACTEAQTPKKNQTNDKINQIESMNTERIVLGGGCFWCVEAVYTELKGVITVKSGYAGGKEKNPTYKEVAYGLTSHAEVVEIVFDADVINLEEILEVFFATHDPTTLNRQGNDVGPQYRSIILYENDQQRSIAESVSTNFAPSLWDDPIVTEIKPLTIFYEAEDYHQEYFANNPNQPYCRLVINPKVQKFRKQFADKLKQD
jgi:peptide-methionine (S)-S-oxide reductase